MFTKLSLSVFSIALSIVLALAAFFLLQPVLANAGPLDPPKISSTPDQAASHSTIFDRSAKIGTITGQLSFPSEHIPPLTIFAIRIDNGL